MLDPLNEFKSKTCTEFGWLGVPILLPVAKEFQQMTKICFLGVQDQVPEVIVSVVFDIFRGIDECLKNRDSNPCQIDLGCLFIIV